jgi:hypothetical protein
MEASVDPLFRGPDWKPITPKRGSLLHADSHLELDDKIPDHSTFSVNRYGRFRDSDILRQVFEAVVRACMDAGLVKGEGFAVDANVIEADASRYHGKAPGEIDWSAPERQTRAVAEFLTALDEGADADRKPPKVISPVDPCSSGIRTEIIPHIFYRDVPAARLARPRLWLC